MALEKYASEDMRIAWESASHNLASQVEFLNLISWKEGCTILDIGCGPGVHVEYFLNKGLKPTGMDRNAANFQFPDRARIISDVAELHGEKFDYVFASHCLEHCQNTFYTLEQWRHLLKPGGQLVVFVPPFYNDISNDHWITGWNAGQLAMTLVAAGFNCRNSCFAQARDQVFGYGHRDDGPQTGFFIDGSLPFLPEPMVNGLFGGSGHQNLRGDIAYVDSERIEYLSRSSAEISIPMDIDGWNVLEGGKSVFVDFVLSEGQFPGISRGKDYILAVISSGGPAKLRLCLAERVADNPYANELDLWGAFPAGLTLRRFQLVDMMRRGGGLDASRISSVHFGGPDLSVEKVRFAMFDGEGSRIF